MSDIIEEILQKLEGYIGIDIDVTDAHVSVRCQNENSFTVALSKENSGYQVNFDGWHEHFSDKAEALNCFSFGLSEECRLKVITNGKLESSWTVQYLRNENWVDDSKTSLIFYPFWHKAIIEYRQNRLSRKTLIK